MSLLLLTIYIKKKKISLLLLTIYIKKKKKIGYKNERFR